jgi:hypothetical protein
MSTGDSPAYCSRWRQDLNFHRGEADEKCCNIGRAGKLRSREKSCLRNLFNCSRPHNIAVSDFHLSRRAIQGKILHNEPVESLLDVGIGYDKDLDVAQNPRECY